MWEDDIVEQSPVRAESDGLATKDSYLPWIVWAIFTLCLVGYAVWQVREAQLLAIPTILQAPQVGSVEVAPIDPTVVKTGDR